MRRLGLFILLIFAAVVMVEGADPPLADGVSGAPVTWSDHVAKRGPLAVLVWASWAPDSETILDRHGEIADACRSVGLELVVLDVQETLVDGRTALASRNVAWIHDRHGALLKQYRVIRIPSILVVSKSGEVQGHLEPSAEAVQGWSRP